MEDYVLRDTGILLFTLFKRYGCNVSPKIFDVQCEGVLSWKSLGRTYVIIELAIVMDMEFNKALNDIMSKKDILNLNDAIKEDKVVGGNYFIIKNGKITYIGKSKDVYNRAFLQLKNQGGDSVKIIETEDYDSLESKYTYKILGVDKFKNTDQKWIHDIFKKYAKITISKIEENSYSISTRYDLKSIYDHINKL